MARHFAHELDFVLGTEKQQVGGSNQIKIKPIKQSEGIAALPTSR